MLNAQCPGDEPKRKIDGLDFLTVTETQELLRRSKSSVYKMVEAHQLPAIKLGGRLIFDRAEVLAWVRKHSTRISEDENGGGKS
jgi:excisionase family DNA binding protein